MKEKVHLQHLDQKKGSSKLLNFITHCLVILTWWIPEWQLREYVDQFEHETDERYGRDKHRSCALNRKDAEHDKVD